MRFTSPRLAQRIPIGIHPWTSVRSACAMAPNGLTRHATKKKRRNVFSADGRVSDSVLGECVLLLSIFLLQKNNLRSFLIRRFKKKSIKIIGTNCVLQKNWHQVCFSGRVRCQFRRRSYFLSSALQVLNVCRQEVRFPNMHLKGIVPLGTLLFFKRDVQYPTIFSSTIELIVSDSESIDFIWCI